MQHRKTEHNIVTFRAKFRNFILSLKLAGTQQSW